MAQRLIQLRSLLSKYNLGGYVLPRTDEHQSEYLTTRDERVNFISGFSGSNALAFISQQQALLWTDSRYFIQAQQELSQPWKLMKMLPGQPRWLEHLFNAKMQPSRVGFDPALVTAKNGSLLTKEFKEHGIQFVPVRENLIDQIWKERPSAALNEIYLHQEWAGKKMSQKVKWIRERIKQKKGQAAILNDLSQIAWVLNLRSSQIPHNPFFKSTLVLTLQGGRLYLPADHPSSTFCSLLSHLNSQNIKIDHSVPCFEKSSLVEKSKLNYGIYSQVEDLNCIQWEGIGLERAVRADKEIEGFRRCHLADGIAMAKFWSWRAGQQTITQYEAARKIDQLRSRQLNNKGLSFDTISAGGPNGAIVHYRPMPESSATITKQMVHLVDSGGQYLDGTTDVTRAFHFGTPSQQQKQAYTRVLKGNLDVERLRWPAGSLSGAQIDVLARRHLWAVGWDYQHGTGHGVGYFAGVHESPLGISRLSHTKFKAGMVVTNEPGYYCQGHFGIRIENMLLVDQREGFNYFQCLTLCPYDKNLVAIELLDKLTIEYINTYHRTVWDKLSGSLQDDPVALEWLKKATEPI